MPRVLTFAFLVLVAFVALVATPPGGRASADPGLTASIASVYFLRYEDAGLHAVAHERVAELAACECLEHEGMRAGTAEVIAFNSGFADPVSRVIGTWRNSPAHDAILGDRGYGRIGCAALLADGTTWFACVLAPGALPPQPAPAAPSSPAPMLLPDTALPPEA